MRRTAIIAGAILMLMGIAAINAQEPASKTQVAIEKTAKTQTVCPVMGGPIDKDLYVDCEGKRVFVCCKMCRQKVQKDAAKYIKLLEEQGVTLEKAGKQETLQPTSSGSHEHQH
ncbi:MAG: hypothetical protein V2A34_09255 [Lentisphaerota bacterium]